MKTEKTINFNCYLVVTPVGTLESEVRDPIPPSQILIMDEFMETMR